jgi:hypothetical protein
MEAVINSRVVRFNPESGEIFMQYRNTGEWRPIKISESNTIYLRVFITDKHYLYHRVVYKFYNPDWNMDCDPGYVIDHKDTNKKNNEYSNLRRITKQQNEFNTNARGTYFDKSRNKWRAQIRLNGKNIYLGRFVLEEDAHQAYLAAKLIYHII